MVVGANSIDDVAVGWSVACCLLQKNDGNAVCDFDFLVVHFTHFTVVRSPNLTTRKLQYY